MKRIEQAELMGAFPLSRYRWDNGLEALLVQNPVSPVAAFLTHFSVGSAQEAPDQRGLAHFFEHMMFRETKTLGDGDFDRIIGEIGGVGLNAFTSYDTTAYHVNVPSEMLERVIALESDRMVNLVLSAELIERERGAVLGEMQMYQDMPSEQLWNTLMATAYPTHPYRHPIIGYVNQVEAFQVPDFERFYRAHYAPNRALVIVAGGFDEDKLLAALDRAYGGLKPGAARPADAPPDGPLAAAQTVRIGHEKVSTDTLVIATRAPGILHPDAPALYLLAVLLSGGQSSPLHRKLVLEGLATHASASLLELDWGLSSPGLFLLDAAMQHGVPAERGERAIASVLADFRDRGIAPVEFERALNQLRLSHYTSLRTNMALARYVGRFALICGDAFFGEKFNEAVERVTPGQVADVLDRYVITAPRVEVVQSPKEHSA